MPLWTTLVALLLSPALAAEAPPGRLKARVVVWDIGFRPPTQEAWISRLEGEVRDALGAGVDVLLFPELIGWGLAPYHKEEAGRPAEHVTRAWQGEVLPRLGRLLAGSRTLVALGSYPHLEPGWKEAFNRASVWHSGAWRSVDKLDPTQGETLEDPPIRAGGALPLFAFRGGTAAVAVCYSVEKPELAARLKAEGVQLLLAPSATEDELGAARVLRSASARAVELGAAVLVAPLAGEVDGWKNLGSAALYLPAQKGVGAGVQERPRRSRGIHREDFTIPWTALLGLRTQGEKPETRPFLAPSPEFRLERVD